MQARGCLPARRAPRLASSPGQPLRSARRRRAREPRGRRRRGGRRTFSRGWTRRSVAGRGRAGPVFFSGNVQIIFVTESAEDGACLRCARPLPSPAPPSTRRRLPCERVMPPKNPRRRAPRRRRRRGALASLPPPPEEDLEQDSGSEDPPLAR